MGNLIRDPETRTISTGASVTNFGLAINRFYTSGGERKQDTCFVDIAAWGKLGETVAQYCSKGSPLFVEGRLNTSTWQDKEGQNRSKLQVIAESVQLIGRNGKPAPTPTKKRVRKKAAPPPEDIYDGDDEAPF